MTKKRLSKLTGTYYKFVQADHSRSGLAYHLGVNTDPLPFDPSGTCRPGGIYFTDAAHIAQFINYGPVLAIVKPIGQSYCDPNGDKWKAHAINVIKFMRPTKKNVDALPLDASIPLHLALFRHDKNFYDRVIMQGGKAARLLLIAALDGSWYGQAYIAAHHADRIPRSMRKKWAEIVAQECVDERAFPYLQHLKDYRKQKWLERVVSNNKWAVLDKAFATRPSLLEHITSSAFSDMILHKQFKLVKRVVEYHKYDLRSLL